MSLTTPTKSPGQPQIPYSPVLLQQSPATLAGQRNLTGLPRVTRDIVADFYNNIQKWNESHIDGGLLVKEIALLKSDAHEEFPKGLDQLMVNLGEIYRRLQMYAKSLTFLSSQMGSMVKLHHGSTPLFFSLTPGQISDIMGYITKAYNSELTRKEYVLSNIAYSRTRHEALFHAACWVHQQYITSNVQTKLEILLVETGYRKIN